MATLQPESTSATAPKVVILMADYGHDPTETAVPYTAFKNAGFDVQFATESGKAPACDKVLIEGLGQKILGAKRSVVQDYNKMAASQECQHPLSWSTPGFTLDDYTLVFLPGGHDKAVRQILDSNAVHSLLAAYFPQTRKQEQGPLRAIGAVCHGVLVLANAKDAEGRSLLHECMTTTLPARFEQLAYWGTRVVLGDYYKTYGAGTEDVEVSIKKGLKDPAKQFKSSLGPSPFVVEDTNYNYVSARFPGDAAAMADRLVELVKGANSN